MIDGDQGHIGVGARGPGGCKPVLKDKRGEMEKKGETFFGFGFCPDQDRSVMCTGIRIWT